MRPNPMNPRTWAAALLGAALPLAGCSLEWHGGSGSSRSLGRVEVERIDELDLPIAAGGRLRAHDLVGDVDVRVELMTEAIVEASKPRLRARWRGYGDDTAESQAALAEARLELTGDATSIELRTIVPASRDGVGATVDLELVVPADLILDLDTRAGDIVVQGPVASATLASGYGDVRVVEVEGDVRASSKSGDLDLSAIGGAVDATTSYGDVTLRACRGPRIVAQSSSGTVAASDGGKASWELASKYGDVTMSGGSGDLVVDTSSGRIDVTRFTGAVRARNGYGAIDLVGTFSSVDAQSSSGDVSLRLEGIDGTLKEIVLESKYGDVELMACTALAGRVTATTRYGDVSCTVPLMSMSRSEDGHRIEGQLGDGDAPIRLQTASGDARVLKGGR